MLTSARATLVHSEHGLAGPRACGGHKLAQQGASYSLLLHTQLCPHTPTSPKHDCWAQGQGLEGL